MYNLKRAMQELTRVFPQGKTAADPFNSDVLMPTEHDLAANKRTGWSNPDIQGDLEQPRDGGDLRNEEMITSGLWGSEEDRVHRRDDNYAATQVRNGLQAQLNTLVNGLYVQPQGQTMTVKQFLKTNPITNLFQSTDRSVRLMGDRIRRELADFLMQNYNQAEIAQFKQRFGSNVTDWLLSKSLKASGGIHEIPDPKVLPRRDDLRSHLSDEAQDMISEAKGVKAKLLLPKQAKAIVLHKETVGRIAASILEGLTSKANSLGSSIAWGQWVMTGGASFGFLFSGTSSPWLASLLRELHTDNLRVQVWVLPQDTKPGDDLLNNGGFDLKSNTINLRFNYIAYSMVAKASFYLWSKVVSALSHELAHMVQKVHRGYDTPFNKLPDAQRHNPIEQEREEHPFPEHRGAHAL